MFPRAMGVVGMREKRYIYMTIHTFSPRKTDSVGVHTDTTHHRIPTKLVADYFPKGFIWTNVDK
jgi:hypothetical protein